MHYWKGIVTSKLLIKVIHDSFFIHHSALTLIQEIVINLGKFVSVKTDSYKCCLH